MTEAAAAPITQEPTKIPPPVAAGVQGAGALGDRPIKDAPVLDDPFEFELDVKGEKQKMKFKDKAQLSAVLQKALFADREIKEAVQAKKATETLMEKLKTPQGLREVLQDPAIGVDVKKFAMELVQEMIEDDRLTPEQKRMRELESYREKTEAEKREKEEAEKTAAERQKTEAAAQKLSGEIIEAMKKYPDVPQTQATMDAVIQNMRAAYRRFGKHLSPEQAMSVYSEQYESSDRRTLEKLEGDKLKEVLYRRFGPKILGELQKLNLQELRNKTNPANQKPAPGNPELKKKKHLTEKDFEKHFQELAGGL